MNQLSYQYFIAVAREKSIRQAAENLMISPQALGEHMRKLEKELDVELFTNTRPVALTAYGLRFLRFCETMISERYKLEKDLHALAEKKQQIVLSAPASELPPHIYDAIAAFSVHHPDILVAIETRPENISPADLHKYDLNISSLSLGRNMTEILLQNPTAPIKSDNPYESSELSVLASQKLLHRFWKEQYEQKINALYHTADLSVFIDIPFVMCTEASLAKTVDGLFQARQFIPTVIAETDSTDICIQLCLAGTGALLFPAGLAIFKIGNHINSEEVQLFHTGEYFPPSETIISYQNGKQFTSAERELLDLLLGNPLP